MPRRVQDIVPGERRTIRDIPLARRQKSRSRGGDEPERELSIHKIPASEDGGPRRAYVTPPAIKTRPHSRLKWLLVALGVIALVGAVGFIASSFYSKASFTIVPKVIPISVNGTYVAQSLPQSGALTYSVITVRSTSSSTVPAVDGSPIAIKSTGRVVLSNSYSAQSIRLIAGTRLSPSSGKLYRLSSSVVIPGYTKSAGTVVPGEVTVGITADQPGPDYDLSKSDQPGELHIAAYLGSPKYDRVYATLASDISGGFVGAKKIISHAVMASTTSVLKTQLAASLLSQIKSYIPDGYIMYDNNYVSAFSQPAVGGTARGSAVVTMQGTFYGIIFKKSDLLAKFSNNQSATAFGDQSYTSPGLDTLQTVITNLKDFSPIKKGVLIIHVKGDLKLVGAIPVDEIKKKLEGISLSATQGVFRSYSQVIESGSGELVPPWAKIPTDPKRIVITVQGQ